MYYNKKEFVLKNGEHILLRQPTDSDASQLIYYLTRVSSETDFLLRSPSECNLTVQEEVMYIRRSNRDKYLLFVVCEYQDQIVGTFSLRFNTMLKTRHRAEVGIAITQNAWGLGIGTIMFEEMIKIAREHGVEQLELDFIDGNKRAESLYTKMGFQQVARKPNAIKQIDGKLVDEIFMIKQL